MLSGCFGSIVNSFCSVYTLEELYPAEQIIIEYHIENDSLENLEPRQLRQKLENISAHDTLDC